MPGQAIIGAKAQSVVRVDVITGQAHFLCSRVGPRIGQLAFLSVSVDIFNNGNCVVNQHAQGQNEAE